MDAAKSGLRHLFYVAFMLAACMQVRAACAEALTIPGSGNPERVLIVLAQAFNSQQPRFQVSIPSSTGTAGAIRDVEAGTDRLGRVERPLKRDEIAGFGATSLGLAYPLGPA